MKCFQYNGFFCLSNTQ